MKLEYEKQVALLVKCIPFISEIDCFALKGGTAINLFYRNLPRLSVDIDLAYIHLNNRNEAIKEINDSLKLISSRMKSNGILSQIQNNKQKYDELITKTEIVLFNSQTKSSPSQKSKADDDGISGRT